jgi:hypothetical protein
VVSPSPPAAVPAGAPQQTLTICPFCRQQGQEHAERWDWDRYYICATCGAHWIVRTSQA